MSSTGDEAMRLFRAIRRIAHAIDLRSQEVARTVGLTIPQIVVLASVRDRGEVTTREISRAAHMTAATVVAILDKLEARGLIERYRSRVDRRIVHTRLTPRGKAVLADAPPLMRQAFREALARLPAVERAALITSVETVADMLETCGGAETMP
jgi:DNA-binding MarR family transcriptional regulator